MHSGNELKAFSIREINPKEKKTISCIFDRGHSYDFCRLSALKLIQMTWCAMEHTINCKTGIKGKINKSIGNLYSFFPLSINILVVVKETI